MRGDTQTHMLAEEHCSQPKVSGQVGVLQPDIHSARGEDDEEFFTSPEEAKEGKNKEKIEEGMNEGRRD